VSFARHFLQYRANWFAFALIAALVIVAVAAPFLTAAQIDERWIRHRALIWGTRDVYLFGLAVTGITATLGVVVGAIAGYAGGLTNLVLMRVTDAFLTFPAIASIYLFAAVMSPGPWRPGRLCCSAWGSALLCWH
jgi:ABC-type antimicrobial peptide transport system permease subunit